MGSGKAWPMVRVRHASPVEAVTIASTPEDERDLASRARHDRDAFGLLYDRYLRRIYAYCYRRLGNSEAAEDATSAIFTKALVAMPEYRPDARSFRSWLFSIAHNAVVDELRNRRPFYPLIDDVRMPGRGHVPEDEAISSDDARTLRALLDQLPADQAHLLELRLAGLNDREIADVLGRSHGAIRIAQRRAISRLRVLFDSESGARDDG